LTFLSAHLPSPCCGRMSKCNQPTLIGFCDRLVACRAIFMSQESVYVHLTSFFGVSVVASLHCASLYRFTGPKPSSRSLGSALTATIRCGQEFFKRF
jgi:hypothetical protein